MTSSTSCFPNEHPEAAHAYPYYLTDFEVLQGRIRGVSNRRVVERTARESRSGIFNVAEQRPVTANARDTHPLAGIQLAPCSMALSNILRNAIGHAAALLCIEVVLQLL